MANLRLCLKQLHSCLPSDENGQSTNISQANLLSGDVAKRALESHHIENTCSALFDDNYGIITFLRKSVNSNELVLSKQKILQFLPQFLNKAGKIILPYAVAIKDVCLWIYMSDKAAKSRNYVLDILLSLLHQCSGNAIGHDLQPDKIIDRFYMELTRASKVTSSVKQNIFHLLGVIAESFPEYVSSYSKRFQTMFCSHLRAQMNTKSKDSDFAIIVGCLLGLNSLLSKFPCTPDDTEEIFSYVRRAITYNKDFKYLVPKAGLKIVSGHAALFQIQMFNHYLLMYENIHLWSTISNSETRNIALVALDKFFQQVAQVICERKSFNKDDPQARRVLLYFLNMFKDIFKLTTSRSVTVAIKGYGYFAAACKLFWNVDEVNVMLSQVLQRCDQLFLSQSDSSKEGIESYLQYLPSFVEALASIISQLDKVPEMFQLDLQNLVIFLIENFPRVIPVYQFLCYNSIIRLLAALYPEALTFRSFVHNSVYQGILRTCSHELPYVENVDDFTAMENLKSITYKSYIPLWSNLLHAVNLKELNDQGVPLDVRQAITDAVYDEIVQSVLTIIAKLDLSCSKATVGELEGNELPSSNPIAGLYAANPKDFQIFVNIVEFCRSLLLEKHVGNFTKWVFRFGNAVTSLSTKNPLVSGFYKLLGMCFKLCSATRHFREIGQDDTTTIEGVWHLDEKTIIFKLFSKYAVEITFRLPQYKDDLLASCLEAILSLPSEIVVDETILKCIIPAVCMAFRMGISYLPLADQGLTAMEMWSQQLSQSNLLPLYCEVLPLFNSFLKSMSRADGVEEVVDVPGSKFSKSRMSFKNPVKSAFKLDDSGREQLVVDAQIKLRIVRLLGSIGNDKNRHIVSALPSPKLAVAWDSHKHLKFAVPFADMKPVIYLDHFLPRVVDLACTSSNRQIKVTAAELLHALVLYTLGSSASKSAVMQIKTPAAKLYRNILPAILQLACDVDIVTKQLFEPLVMQIIHWLSNNKKGEDDVEVLMDALMDGIVSTTDSALRDFCGRCLREFMVWSIKQSTPKEQESNPHNTRSLLDKIYSMCLHPSSSLRLGAALAFNSIYTILREETALVDTFTFDILYHFVQSLALSQKDEEEASAREQCLLALDHVQRIMLVKSELLNKESSKRRNPPGFSVATLTGAVKWLLLQCGRQETDCRHRCMHLVYQLCSNLPGVASTSAYFHQILAEHGAAYFVLIFEGSLGSVLERPSLHSMPTLRSCITAPFGISQMLRWFDMLLATLDCYMWVFNAKLLQPTTFFSDPCLSSLSISFSDFLDNVVLQDLEQKAKEFGHTEVLTPRTVATYNRAKCTIVVRCLDFAQALMQPPFLDSDALRKFFNDSFWKLFLRCILCPLSVGFDMSDVEVLRNLPQVTSQLLTAVWQCHDLSADMSTVFKTQLKDANSEFNLFDKLDKIIIESRICFISLRLLVDGYVQLVKDGFLLVMLGQVDTQNEDLVSQLLQTAWRMCIVKQEAHTIEGDAHCLAARLVCLALRLNKNLETLSEYLLNAEAIARENSKNFIKKSMHFYMTFKDEVNVHLIKNYDKSVVYLMSNMQQGNLLATDILLGVLDNLITTRDLRKAYGCCVNRALCSNWDKLQGWCVPHASEERKMLMLLLFQKMFLVDSTFSAITEFTPALDSYLTMLVDKTTSLKFKSGILNLLPFFTRLPSIQLATLKSHLVKLASHHFPLRSSELQTNSSMYSDYVHAFRKILAGLQLSGSLMLFELVVELTCIEDSHVLENELQDSIFEFIKRASPCALAAAVRFPFGIFTDELSKPSDVRKSALTRFCLPLLSKINQAILLDFFEENIGWIMDSIQSKLIRGAEAKVVSQLVSKAGCFQLMDVLYHKGSKDQLATLQSKINCAFLKRQVEAGKLLPGKETTGKELTQEISRTAHSAKKENIHGVTDKLGLQLEYHCAAYNALMSVIRCTQTDVKFYTVFLFSENLAKGEYLWDNIVDTTMTYVFDMELEVPIAKRQILKNTRHEAHAASRPGDDDGEDGGDIDSSYPLTIRQLTTQNLASSSLAEDVSQFDFTSSEVHFERGARDLKPKAVMETGEHAVDAYFEMEMDDLNRHDCMAPLGSLLHHLTLKVTPPPSTEQAMNADVSVPPWMKCIRDKFVDEGTHKNVKMFVARLIFNNKNIFRPYAKIWLLPLMQFIVSGVSGNGLNYFVTDLVTMLLSWRSVAIPEDTMIERAMANSMLEFLMQNAYHITKKILKYNMEVIKTVIECWKTRLDMPWKVIYNNLSDPNPVRLTNLVGLQFVGILLSSGFTLMPMPGVDCEKFLKTLSENMNFTSKEVYECAAEVCGMTLKQLSEKAKSNDFPFLSVIKERLGKLRDSSIDKFLICLHHIQSSYPPAVDSFLTNVLFQLPRCHGIFQVLALEIVMSRLDCIENAYQELSIIGLEKFLVHGDEQLQITGIKIINKMLPQLTASQILNLHTPFEQLAKHENPGCRKLMFDALIWIHDHYSTKTNPAEPLVVSNVKSLLLLGLVDCDLPIRLTVLNFWSNKMPSATPNRLVNLITDMYLPLTEQHYLGYCTNLLLELTSKSPDFNRAIFENPLSDCKFQDYSVTTSWRARHASMVPLFVDTQSSQMGSQEVGPSLQHVGQLRATQDNREFAPTQELDSKRPFNWLTQNTFDPSVSISASVGDANQSSSMFRPRKSFSLAENQLGKVTLKSANQNGADDVDIRLMRRRFVKDTDASRMIFKKRHARLQKQREEFAHNREMARESQVTMYRQYRMGDFPDILIPHSAIIAPLQALAQVDNEIAQMLFVDLSVEIFDGTQKMTTGEEWANTVSSIKSGFDKILMSTKTYDRSLVTFILEFYFKNCSHFMLDMENLMLALKHCGQSIGFLLLEKMIMQGNVDEVAPVKRARKDRDVSAADKALWLKLAELNKGQGNFEVARAIFAHKISTCVQTREALQAEELQNYSLALKKYKEVDKKYKKGELTVQSVDIAEVDLWEGSILKCYDRLTKWDNLCQYAQTDNSLDNLWSDIAYQELHLPYVVRGKLKLIMKGGEEQTFVKFVDDSLLVSGRQQFLESCYPEELALLSVVQKDYNRARFYQDMCVKNFLRDWCSLSQLNSTGHKHLLLRVQKLVEMDEFLNTMRNSPNSNHALRLMKNWSKRLPISTGDMVVTNDIVDNRLLYMKHLEILAESPNESLNDEFQMEIEQDFASPCVKKLSLESQLSLSLLCVDSCCNFNNLILAFEHLKKSFKLVNKLDDVVKRVQCYHAYAEVHLQQSKLNKDAQTITDLVKVWDHLHEKVDRRTLLQHTDLNLEHLRLLSNVAEHFVDHFENNNHLLDAIPSDRRADFFKRIECQSHNLKDIVDGLTSYSYFQLSSSAKQAADYPKDCGAKAQFHLATFCDQHLRQWSEGKAGGDPLHAKAKEYATVLMINLLDAIRLGSQEAVQLFPRLLQLLEEHPHTHDIFTEKVNSIPCWVLIRWSSQLVALLDKPVAPAIHNLVTNMVEAYPNALIYPFRVSRKGFIFDNSCSGKKNLIAVENINRILSKLWLVDHFMLALEHLSYPGMDYKDQSIKLIDIIEQDREAFLKCFQSIYETMFVKPLEDHDVSVPYGKFKISFAKKYKSIFEQSFGEKFSTLKTISRTQFLQAQKQIVSKFERFPLPKSLRDYCDWLADFQLSKYGMELEVPGQYDGLRKPMPEYHTKIAKFGDNVLVMQSIRKPKRILIYGNDYKEYKMLIKNGEDLRTDQRIEQLFQIMNQIYDASVTSRDKELKIVTYQVIPLNDRLGMLEWLDNTVPLKEFLDSNMSVEERDLLQKRENQYYTWMEKEFQLNYSTFYSKCSSEVALEKYRKVMASVPKYLLKTSFLSMSTGIEAFLSLRTHFIVSHAVMCVSQYILGIGDRHTSNMLVCQKTGAIVGIDFGHAFGSATQFLQVPELIPIRLTPQFLNLMDPMREHGLLESTMAHAMSALRKNPNVLLSTMDVFITEPTLDWINFAMKQKKDTQRWNDDDPSWFPRQKIDVARRKLLGDNCAYLLKEDLELGHKKNPNLTKLKQLCLGKLSTPHRKQFAAKGLPVETQIACLLSHATDETILAHTWRGWKPWM